MRSELLQQVAQTFDTPCFLLSLDRLDRNIEQLREALRRSSSKWRVLYSVKTNYLPAVVERIKAAGMGCDCVSDHEMRLAVDLGFAPGDIVLNGPMKTPAEIRFAIEHGVLINIDGPDELPLITAAAQALAVRAKVGIRLHPGRNVYPSPDPSFNALAGWKAARSKFGWNVFDAATDELIASIARSRDMKLVGVHCHLGSQITDPRVFAAALEPIFEKAAHIRREAPLALINVGGGFGVQGISRDRSGPLASYVAALGMRSNVSGRYPAPEFRVDEFIELVDALACKHRLKDVELACEPGRYLVSDAMQILARVRSVKRSSGHGTWVVVDAGLNILPTAGPLEMRSYRILRSEDTPNARFMLGGPLCYEGDVFSFDVELPADVRAGDLMLIEDAGAYSVSRSTNFIRPRACVVAIRGDEMRLCWRRETYGDIFAFHVAQEHPETHNGAQLPAFCDHRSAPTFERDARRVRKTAA